MSLVPEGMTVKQARVRLDQLNREYPDYLVEVPRNQWGAQPWDDSKRVRVFRSKRFLLQVFEEPGCAFRLSINRTELAKGGERWEENISWDDLQRLKREAGFGDWFAVEIYPRDHDLVNVANMRHLWILAEPMACGWRTK